MSFHPYHFSISLLPSMPPPNLSPTTISKELTLDLPTTLQFPLYKIQIRFPLPSSVHMATGPTLPFELRGSLTPTELFSPASALLRSRQLTGKPKHKPTGVFFLQNHNGPKSRSIGCQIHPKFPCSPAHYSSGRNVRWLQSSLFKGQLHA